MTEQTAGETDISNGMVQNMLKDFKCRVCMQIHATYPDRGPDEHQIGNYC
jgi:hypothetical protein